MLRYSMLDRCCLNHMRHRFIIGGVKNPHAVALGRLGGLKGGPARTASVPPERRRDIARRAAAARWSGQLPELMRSLFWEYPFDQVRLPDHRSEVLLKALEYGNAEQLAWVRRRIGDARIRKWIIARKGRGLTPDQMAPWVSLRTAQRWISADPIARIWAER